MILVLERISRIWHQKHRQPKQKQINRIPSTRKLLQSNGDNQQREKQPTEREKICVNWIADNGPISKHTKNSLIQQWLFIVETPSETQFKQQWNPQNPIQNGPNIWIEISSEKTHKGPAGTWENAQRHQSSGDCTSEVRWDTTSHPSGWMVSKTPTSVGREAGKHEPSCAVGGNAEWRNLCGKQRRSSWKN